MKMNESNARVLIRAKEMLSTGWHKGSYARDEQGNDITDRRAERACSWCLSGAIEYAAEELNAKERRVSDRHSAWDAKEVVVSLLPSGMAIPGWNDADFTTFEDVIAVVDKAIEQEKRNALNDRVFRVFNIAIEKLESGWTQGQAAVDATGYPVTSTSADACKWCALGAIQCGIREVDKSPEHDSDLYHECIAALRQAIPGSIVNYNDAKGRRKASVVKRFKQARDLLKSKQQEV